MLLAEGACVPFMGAYGDHGRDDSLHESGTDATAVDASLCIDLPENVRQLTLKLAAYESARRAATTPSHLQTLPDLDPPTLTLRPRPKLDCAIGAGCQSAQAWGHAAVRSRPGMWCTSSSVGWTISSLRSVSARDRRAATQARSRSLRSHSDPETYPQVVLTWCCISLIG